MQAEFLTRIILRGSGVGLMTHEDTLFAERVPRKIILLVSDRCHRQVT